MTMVCDNLPCLHIRWFLPHKIGPCIQFHCNHICKWSMLYPCTCPHFYKSCFRMDSVLCRNKFHSTLKKWCFRQGYLFGCRIASVWGIDFTFLTHALQRLTAWIINGYAVIRNTSLRAHTVTSVALENLAVSAFKFLVAIASITSCGWNDTKASCSKQTKVPFKVVFVRMNAHHFVLIAV